MLINSNVEGSGTLLFRAAGIGLTEAAITQICTNKNSEENLFKKRAP
jgi:hypothetical protein